VPIVRIAVVTVIGVLLFVTDASAQTGAPAPARPVEFTVATGVLVGDIRGAVNVKVVDYVYIADPIGRGLTMAGVAIHIKNSERFAVLAGGLITPAGGLGLGASWMVVRNVAINAGLATMLVHASRDRLPIGAVAEPLSSPFEPGVSYAWFIGANYTFR
jgi:hypothetical protein